MRNANIVRTSKLGMAGMEYRHSGFAESVWILLDCQPGLGVKIPLAP